MVFSSRQMMKAEMRPSPEAGSVAAVDIGFPPDELSIPNRSPSAVQPRRPAIGPSRFLAFRQAGAPELPLPCSISARRVRRVKSVDPLAHKTRREPFILVANIP